MYVSTRDLREGKLSIPYRITREDEVNRIYPRCRSYSQDSLLDKVPSSYAVNACTQAM